QLLADRLDVTEVMMMFDQTIEQHLLRSPPYQAEFQGSQILQTGFENGRIDVGNIGTAATKQWIVWSDFGRWQLDMPAAVQRQHQSAADHVAWRAIGLHPIPGSAQLLR